MMHLKNLGSGFAGLKDEHHLGGSVGVPLHLDGVVKSPTVFMDGRKIMDEGKLLIK